MSSIDVCDARRVSVQTHTERLDLVLPTNVIVAALIPSICDLVAATGSIHEVPADLQLSRVDGRPLTQRRSLHDNGIRDGDLLILSPTPAATPPSRTDDAIAGIAASLDHHPRWTPAAAKAAGSTAALLCYTLGAYGLLHGDRRPAAVVAGLLSLAALAAAVVCARVYREGVPAVTLGCCAVVGATVAGYLAVPGAVVAPKFMLAAAICATLSIVATRAMATGTAVFAAAASAGMLSAAGAAVPVLVPVTVSATGASLAAAAIATLAFAPRLAMWTGRIDADPHAVHAITTGLVCGSSAVTALGAVLTTSHGAVFAAVAGAVLVMRAGTHVDLIQVGALFTGAAACFASVFLWGVRAHPHAAHWISLVMAGAAVAAAAVSAAAPSVTLSPLARRCAELAEYAALAAVLPLACWVSGALGAVRAL